MALAKQTQKQAYFMVAAGLLSSLLGACIEQGLIPHPYAGMAVSISMFLATLVRPPAAPAD
jgi:hypothetical protein